MTTPVELPGWTHSYSGKVRDLYTPSGDEGAGTGRLLVVASDRVSAFDYLLSPGIPDKGALLTTLSLWWFDQLAGADGGTPIPNHLVDGATVPDAVAGRAMVVQALDMLPVECVVRGYITGSGWAEYQQSGTVCGIPLPEGLSNGDRLPQPIFTPAHKAPMGEHDENITFAQTVDLVGAEHAAAIRDLSIDVYRRAAATALDRGLILADTKFEFGVAADGTITLADEVLTADSSRYWDAEAWRTGSTPDERMASFDKQIVRNWLAAHWTHAPGGSAPRVSDAASERGEDKTGEPPTLPAEIVQQTAARYRELIERLTAPHH
ncbi:phosphoribosylaminoimidazolesuccinocarboxamide synthase [Microbacterium terrisoli]|uniref:phosphoribosylaminoimidazolesuccinocarboxamide synthase n=1 Tax=Microbacterium terrisoli TaxID=3242192 RepID=UPI0028064B2D|nr:phosphoribosylaminoimidazolesuccinocarboxamide synthase [Microbacterium protaetiae]